MPSPETQARHNPAQGGCFEETALGTLIRYPYEYTVIDSHVISGAGEKNGNSYRQRADHMPMLIGLPPIPLVSLPTLLLSSKLSVVCSCLCCSNRVFFALFILSFPLIMTLVRFPGALEEFGGASPAFRLPIQTKASTTWLGEETPKKEERAAAMALQIDGWTEGQVVLTKEEVYALNKEMTKQEGLTDGKHLWLGTPTRLKMLTTENIGGILTLSSLRKQYAGAGEPDTDGSHGGNEQLAIICSAMPSGTALGQKYILGNSKLGHLVTNGSEMDNEDLTDTDEALEPLLKLTPGGFETPHAIIPILACISRETRAPLQSTREDWFEDIRMDMLIFPRGDKLLQPVVLAFHSDETPTEGAVEHELIGGAGHWTDAPVYQHGETPLWAYASEKDLTEDTTKVTPFGRCFFLPPNHGMPLGLPIDPAACNTTAQLKEHCIAFTGLPSVVYDWMDDNLLLQLWLKGCSESSDVMKTETWLMSQVTSSWELWKSKKSLAAQQTFHHPELLIRARILWDHLVHTLEPNWRDKLLLLGQNAQTIFQNSPDIASFQEARMENMWYLAGLLNIKTFTWCKQFEISFLRQGLPDWLDRYARVDISATTSATDLARLRITSKASQMASNTPGSAATNKSRRPIGDLVSKVFNDRFSAGMSSPLQLKHSALDNNPPDWYDDDRRSRAEGMPGTAKTLFQEQQLGKGDSESVKYIGSKRPPSPPSTPPRMKLPQRHTMVAQQAVTSGLYLPFEQPMTQMHIYMTDSRDHKTFGKTLVPTASDIEDTHIFARDNYIKGSMLNSVAQLAHLGAFGIPPGVRMGPPAVDGETVVYPDYSMLLPGLVSKQYCANVLHSKNHPADIHQAGNFIQTEYDATLRSSFTTYFRPLLEGDTFYSRPEILCALQSGVVSAGTAFQASSSGISAGITPYHFLPTILGNSFRLPADGLSCLQMVQLIKNMGWWLHVVFHFPSHYRNLQQLNDELSPFLVASPLAGQLHWLTERLTQSQAQKAWDKMPPRHRVAATNAVLVSLSNLVQVFLDWAVTHTMEQHCLQVFLWDDPARSDLSVLESTIRVRDYSPITSVLQDWRRDCTNSFNVTVFTAHTLPINVFYSRQILPDIAPARPVVPPHLPPTRPDRPGASGNQRNQPPQQPQPQQPQAAQQNMVLEIGDGAETQAAIAPQAGQRPLPLQVTMTLTSSADAPTRDTVPTRAPTPVTSPTLPPSAHKISQLRAALPPFPSPTSASTTRRNPSTIRSHTKASWPAVTDYNQYFATVVAPVWAFLEEDDSRSLQAANPQNNHPLYGSASLLHLDNKHWQRRRHGWGKETHRLQTEHDSPSIFHVVHLLWDYLRVSLRRLMAVTLRDTAHDYASLRRRASTTPVYHLRYERHYPSLDLTPICEHRVLDMGAALLRCDFNYGDLIRWLAGEYTQQNQDRSLLREVITAVRHKVIPRAYPPIDFQAALHAIDEGVPGVSTFRCPIRDVAKREKENNRGLEHCWDDIMEKYRKEEKLSYHIMFPRFLWKYIPGLFLALISYIPPKPGRIGDEGRLINDPSTPLYPGDRGNVNGQIPKIKMNNHEARQNPKVYYGSVIHRLVNLIYNLRLDNPEEELYIAADDISAAFRWLHYHPDIAVAFATVLHTWLVVPVGMIFGGRFSPGWYMILGELRGHIAATLDIGTATTDLSSNITLSPPLNQQDKATIVPAVRDGYNTGAAAILGSDYKFGFSSFVDDQGVVATRSGIQEAIHRSVIAARVVFGEPNPKHRSPCINDRKWKSDVSHQLLYLGLDWDTRLMTVGWPDAKQRKLAIMLEQMHSDWLHNKSFKTVIITAADKSSLVGLMRHGAFVADLADFLAIRVQQSLSDAARQADEQAKRIESKKRQVNNGKKPSSRAWWRKGRISLSKEVLDDLRMLYPTLNNPKWQHVWQKPIGLMVDREPTNTMKGDASTKGIGGWNLTLLFMWRLNDDDLASCKFKMRKFNTSTARRPLTADEYHINILEFVAIIVNVVLALGKPPSRQGQCGGRPPLSLHAVDSLVGIRYLSGHAGIGSLQSLPSGARAAFNNLVRDQWERERGDIRSRNDRAFDQRASHFGKWSLQAGFTDKSFEEVSPGQEIVILAGYLFAVASGKTSLELDKNKLKGRATAPQDPLMVKTLVGYLNAAHSLLELFLNRKFSIHNPNREGYHPMLADILASRRKWQKAREKREPFTNKMFEFLYASLKQATAKNVTVNLDVQAAVFDWTCLGAFTGSRANEYAQTTARRGCFSKVPANKDAGEWANQPLAFIDLDFMFYTSDSVLLPHDKLLQQQSSAAELHLRFRYDKSQTNFTIRKFKRSGHPFICPIAASISIIGRARCLHRKPFKEPLGVFRTSNTGSYDYLQSRDIIKVMRAAVVGAYPNPQHFLRQNVTHIVAHSNRVTAAVALQNAGLDIQEIAFRLRWSAPSVQHYLRESSQEVGRLTLKAIQGAVLL